MAIEIKPRVAMPEQPPEERIKNFNEVPLGLTEEMAHPLIAFLQRTIVNIFTSKISTLHLFF